MDQNRFAVLTRAMTGLPSRRDVLRGLVGMGLGLEAVRLPQGVTAKKKRKKVTFNAFGCVNVGDFCKRDDQCCSGICDGKKGKKKCQAHDSGGCRAGGQTVGCGGTDVVCTTSTGNPEGVCTTTTGNGGYCVYSGACFPCTKDADCQAFCGPQGACFVCDDCPQTGGTSCGSPSDNGCNFPAFGQMAVGTMRSNAPRRTRREEGAAPRSTRRRTERRPKYATRRDR